MRLFEYEAKALLSEYGLPIPIGETITTRGEARETAIRIGLPVVVKGQFLVAARGRAGGILFATTPEEAEDSTAKLFQTSIGGAEPQKVLIEQKIDISKELYLGMTIDRLNRSYIFLSSKIGGMNIEEVAEQNPQTIHRTLIKPQLGLRDFHARQISETLGYSGNQMLDLAHHIQTLYKAGTNVDAELIELNPLVETRDGKFIAVDAHILIDDNALYRHPEIKQKQLAENRELSLQEFQALKNDLNYVKLDGNVGIVGNGAGLVMATMDMINLYGGKPANFLDVGGGAPIKKITTAVEIVLSDPQVKVLFINILGGITLCDEVALGIVQAKRELTSDTTLVIRLVGTNEEEGKRILHNAGLPTFESMEEAAQEAVELSMKET